MRRAALISASARILGAALAVWLTVGEGHHFFATEYAEKDMVTIRGVVTEVRYRNPHVQLLVAVPGEQGEEEVWAANTVSNSVLKRRPAIDSDMICPIDRTLETGCSGSMLRIALRIASA